MSDNKKETGKLAELVKAAKRFSQLEKKAHDTGADPNQLPPEEATKSQVVPDSEASSGKPLEDTTSNADASPLIVENIDETPADAQKKTFLTPAIILFSKLNRRQKFSVFLVLGLVIIGIFGPDTGSQVSTEQANQPSSGQDSPSSRVPTNHAPLTTDEDHGWVTVDNQFDFQSMEINFDLDGEDSTLVDPQPPADQTTIEEQASNVPNSDATPSPSLLPGATERISPESLLPPMSPTMDDLGLLPPPVEPLVELAPPPPINSVPEPVDQKEISAEVPKKGEKSLSTDKKTSKVSESKPQKKVVAKTKAATTQPRVDQAVLRPQIKDLVIYRASPDCDICIPHAYFKIGKDEHEVGDGLEWEGFKVRINGDRMTLSKNSKSFDFWYR